MNRFSFSVDRPLAIDKCFILALLLFITGNIYAQQPSTSGPFIPITKADSVMMEEKDSAAKVSVPVTIADSVRAEVVSKDSLHRDSVLTVAKNKRHSPLKAALFSLGAPGLGQIYNKRYWKLPIIYAGFGGLGFAIYHTATNFHGYRRAYRAQVALPPDPLAEYKGVNDQQTLKSYRDYYKRYLDISVICFSLWHVLQIVDATVDAHLFEWNMRDDLSLSWQPALIAPPTSYSSAATGVQVCFRF